MPFCKNCGRELQEGETCNCQESKTTTVVIETNSEDVNQSSTSVASNAPIGKFDFMLLLKSLWTRLIGVLPNKTYNEIKSAAQDKSLTWILLALVEMIIGALSFTVCLRRSIFKLLVQPFSFGDVKYSEFAKEASEIGLGFFSIFFRSMLIIFILILTLSIATWLFTLVLKKNSNISCILNTITTIMLPFTVITLVCLIVSFAIAKLALCLLVINMLLLVILNYIAVKELCGYDDSAIWNYALYMIIVDVVNMLAIGKILLPALGKVMNF